MSSLGCSCYQPLGWMNWAPVLGMFQEPERCTGSAYKSLFNLTSWAWGVGLRAYFLNPIRFDFDFCFIQILISVYQIQKSWFWLTEQKKTNWKCITSQINFYFSRVARKKITYTRRYNLGVLYY